MFNIYVHYKSDSTLIGTILNCKYRHSSIFLSFDFRNFWFNEIYNSILFSFPLVLLLVLSNFDFTEFSLSAFFMCPHISSINWGIPVVRSWPYSTYLFLRKMLNISELFVLIFAGAHGQTSRRQALQMWGLPQAIQPQDRLAAAHVPAHRREAFRLWCLWQRFHTRGSHGQTFGYSQEKTTHTHDMTTNGS